MLKTTFSLITILSVLLIYLSNKHQRLLTARLPKAVRYLAITLLVSTLLGWANTLTLSAAIFFWLMHIMTTLLFIPFTVYWLKASKRWH